MPRDLTGEAPPFPLPAGHFFGLFPGDLRAHDGRGSLDSMSLKKWQDAYGGRWQRPQMVSSGKYDGPTQRGVVEVQRTLGLPVTGLLGPAEWAAVWERPPPPAKPRPPKQVPEHKQPWKRVVHARKALEKFSRWKIRYGSDPNAPPWFPGRPFGIHERGPHVERLRVLLGMSPTPRIFTYNVAQRVCGIQRAYGLPVSGICDFRVAAILDPPVCEYPAGATPRNADASDSEGPPAMKTPQP